jgi:hypothetical protein
MAVSMKMAVLWVVAPCDWYKFNNVSEVCTASIIRVMSNIALMMGAVVIAETLLNLYQSTRSYNVEDRHLYVV